ncbi:MAG: HEAT repeat domain-containing protein [Dehalococcoidia bacterium]|nr:HEAT repeat domain-containing protein [Dehalococcoidia bacterium]
MQGLSSGGSPKMLMGYLMHHPSEYTRGCAALALGQVKERRALKPLLQSLDDASSWVRGWSAYALGQLQEPNTLSALCNTLGDDDSWVRQQAADALMCFDSRLADNALVQSLKWGNATAKAWSLHVIAGRGQPDLALDVVPILEDEGRSVRLSAVRALYRLGQAAAIAPVSMFLHDSDEHLRGAAAYALGALGDHDSVSSLSLALTDTKAWVRRNAAWSLLELGEALSLVASMAKDEDAGVRLFAATARERLRNLQIENMVADSSGDHIAGLFPKDQAV